MKFKCEKCGHCCNDPSIIVTVTHHDIQRITRFLSFTPQEAIKFLAFYYLEDSAAAGKFIASPPIRTIKGDTFLGLLKDKEGKCVFLDNGNRCSIYPVRPMECRAFPFTFDVKKRWLCWGVAQKAKQCRGLNKGNAISAEVLDKIGSVIVRERADFVKLVSIWNDLTKDKGINPVPELLLEFFSRALAIPYARK